MKLLLTLGLLAAATLLGADTPRKPNVIFILTDRSEIFVNRLFAPQTGQTVVRVGGHQGSDSVSISHPPLKPLPAQPPQDPVS